ncbi:MAG TPA: hypothetical protein VFF17_01750 [Thermoanaerobaculia bacterium]|nr:hypothetical protein [Thermoanaerobaculia bacterium]
MLGPYTRVCVSGFRSSVRTTTHWSHLGPGAAVYAAMTWVLPDARLDRPRFRRDPEVLPGI